MLPPNKISGLDALPFSDSNDHISEIRLTLTVNMPLTPGRDALQQQARPKRQKKVVFSLPETPRCLEPRSYPLVQRRSAHPPLQKLRCRWEPVVQPSARDGKVEDPLPLPSIPVRRLSFEKLQTGDPHLLPWPRHAEIPSPVAPCAMRRRKAHPPIKKGADGRWVSVGCLPERGGTIPMSSNCSPTSPIDQPAEPQRVCDRTDSSTTCLTILVRRLSADRNEKVSSKPLCMPTRRGTFDGKTG